MSQGISGRPVQPQAAQGQSRNLSSPASNPTPPQNKAPVPKSQGQPPNEPKYPSPSQVNTNPVSNENLGGGVFPGKPMQSVEGFPGLPDIGGFLGR